MEFLVITGRIQMERFIPVESFRKKGDIFRGTVYTFSRFYRNFRKFSVPFVHSYSARLDMVILLRKNAKYLKDGSRLPSIYHYNVCRCLSVVLADVLELVSVKRRLQTADWG